MKLPSTLLFVYLLVSSIPATTQSNDRVLVISGGGARGAWGGGVAKRLVQDSGYHYRAIFGTSSGSLLAPMIALGDVNKMEKGFTEVNQKDIFNRNPFNKKGDVKGFATFLKIAFGSKNLGETKNLKKNAAVFFANGI